MTKANSLNQQVTQYNTLVGDAGNQIANVATGNSGQVLTSNGASLAPTYQDVPAGGITTINGNSGSMTGSTVTIEVITPFGGTPTFINSGSTSNLQFHDANANVSIGYGISPLVGTGNTSLGYTTFNTGITGNANCALGKSALQNLTSGNNNVAIGFEALDTINTGSENVLIGNGTGSGLTTGSFNTFIGYLAGVGYTGSDSSNICIDSAGVSGESHAVRIGNQGSGDSQQNTCFIAGITGSTVTGTAVLCATDGQLGTIASSERYKENIKPIDENVSVLNLKPVEFNYKKDKEKTLKYGLIAEQVEKDFPYLCFYNDDGVPESVTYHELPVLLLHEIQKLNKRIEELEKNK